MKRLLSLLCLCTLGVAQAQLSATYDPEFDARERVRIEAERGQALERYGGEEADCYQRFAVNDCLREVRKRRRVSLEELRRQEIILNDAQRAAMVAEQQRRVEERQAEREGAAAQAQREAFEKARAEREQASRVRQERQAERAQTPTSGASAPVPGGTRQPGSEAARRAEQQRAYEARQKQAEERRRQHDKQQREQGPANSKPLPVPP